MATKTITVSVEAEVEKKFRRIAKATQGKKKGYLGRALTDAMAKWTLEKEEKDNVARALQLLDRGVDLGGFKYKHRDELHER